MNDISEKKLSKLKNLPYHSAGQILTRAIPVVSKEAHIGFIENLLLKEIRNFENINYIYVVDERNHLKGVLSIKELFRVPKDISVTSIMNSNPITVRPGTDRERVALLAIKHNIKNIPVVDKDGIFLGIVPSDVILNVLHQEGIEDVLSSAGILKHDSARDFIIAKTSVHFKKRLPWLIVGLFGGFVAAFVVGFFEDILSKMIILAAFIPSVVYMADAVGSQTQTIFIRSLFLDHKMVLKDYVKREISVSALLAVFLSILAAGLTFWWWKEGVVALIIGISFFATIATSALSGVLLPLLFYKLKVDPAIASGPFSTVLRDILSILIYFTVAFTVLNIIG